MQSLLEKKALFIHHSYVIFLNRIENQFIDHMFDQNKRFEYFKLWQEVSLFHFIVLVLNGMTKVV